MSFEDNARIFLKTIADASRLLGVSLSHEDTQGSFVVGEYDEANVEWLMQATIADPAAPIRYRGLLLGPEGIIRE